MACQKGYFHRLLLSCVVLTLFSGCATKYRPPVAAKPKPVTPVTDESRPVPVTRGIFNRVNEDDQKKPKPRDFQYYISKGITLNLVKLKEQFTVVSGELLITKQTKREQVTIVDNLPGLIYTEVPRTDDKGYLLEVHFEEKHPDCFIKFHQLLSGDDENYYLLYDDINNRTIKYGDDYYTVTIDGIDPIDPPHLLIRMKSADISGSDTRMASGIKLH
jgi:hypothetical protein